MMRTPHSPPGLELPCSRSSSRRPVNCGERNFEMAAQLPEIRSDRVAQLRAQIADGSYDTAEKLDLAMERLLDEIA